MRMGWGAGLAIVVAGVAMGQTSPVAPPTPGDPAKAPETHITKQQAEELFRDVDQIVQFAGKDSSLPVKRPVKKKLITRDEVQKYVRTKFEEDEGAKRMQRSEIVLKKFGLLDRDFDLKPFLVSLLTEQIAGFYDSKSKTVNMLDWISPEEQKPVMAHELTHALQDQTVDLTKWTDQGLKDVSKNVQSDNEHIRRDEMDTTREAVLEGQAMVVFVDYTMKESGRTLAEVPEEMMGRMREMLATTDNSPVLARAPLVLQQSLLFPYGEGLSFEQSILRRKGAAAAFTGVLSQPPSTTAEILHPEVYLARTPQPVLHLPDVHPIIEKDYVPYDVGVLGEFDVRMLTELFAGQQMAEGLAPAWAGGVYFAAVKKTAQANPKTGDLGLIYYSRWKNEDSARSFEHIYSAQLPRKYSGLKRRNADEKDGEEVYSTNEGDVLLWNTGTGVFISEGYDLATARKLRDLVTETQGEGPMRVADSLSGGLLRGFAGFGAMKAGLHLGARP